MRPTNKTNLAAKSKAEIFRETMKDLSGDIRKEEKVFTWIKPSIDYARASGFDLWPPTPDTRSRAPASRENHMRDFQIYVVDDRYLVPNLRLFAAATAERAQEVAGYILAESLHHTGVEIWERGVCLSSVPRPARAASGHGHRHE